MSEFSAVVDITSFNGVESLFTPGTSDPWGHHLAGRLADVFVYSETLGFTMPVLERLDSPLSDSMLPGILTQLRSRDSVILTPVLYEVDDRTMLSSEYLSAAFDNFSVWARNSKQALNRWLHLHNQPWIRDSHFARVRPRYVFDVDRLYTDPSLHNLANYVGIPEEDILYAFDVVLRYPLYGELVAEGSYFLAHPIREMQTLPTMTIDARPTPAIALSLSKAVEAMVKSMTLEEYTAFLHEARGLIRDRRIHTQKPGTLGDDTVREIASSLGLPARLKATGKALGIVAGAITVVGAFPIAGPVAAVAGGLVSVASAIWTGTVGRTLSRQGWLRWALKWDVEGQASDT